jgi:hypothetical protein
VASSQRLQAARGRPGSQVAAGRCCMPCARIQCRRERREARACTGRPGDARRNWGHGIPTRSGLISIYSSAFPDFLPPIPRPSVDMSKGLLAAA